MTRRPPGVAAIVRLLPTLCMLVLLSGCTGTRVGVFEGNRSPACEYDGQPGTPMIVLEAQAVPSATLLPCIKELPAGWSVSDAFIQNGRARFTLDSDRAGPRAVTVVLEQHCHLPRGVTRVPSDESGTRRYEQVGEVRVGAGYVGNRYYVFPGGCVTYSFRFSKEERAAPIGDATLGLSFVSRESVRELVRTSTGGRAELDPPREAAS